MLIKKWILKAVVQKVISLLPFSFRINYFFQRYVTRRVRLTDEFLDTMLEHYSESVDPWIREIGPDRPYTVLELGTGWHPVIPLLHYLSGAEPVVTLDLRPLMNRSNLFDLLTHLVGRGHAGSLQEALPVFRADRFEKLEALLTRRPSGDADRLLTGLRIYQRLDDATKMPFDPGCFDFVTSINVLEHVDAKLIPSLMRSLQAMTRRGGWHYHAIGTYDHFVHVDPSISKFNYLRFSRRQWKWIDNSIQPQNRLRISWFRDLFLELGFVIEAEMLWDPEPGELAKVDLHPDFRGIELSDVPYGRYLLSQPPPS